MPKTRERLWFASADGEHRCALSLWRPDTPVRGVVQIVHGMREHMGRYGDFAAYLNQQGYAVGGHDLLGHGETAADDQYGFFGEEDGCRILLRDCHRASSILRGQYPYRPLFLLGHSMGSFLARLYVLHFSRELAGFLCLGTAGEQRGASHGRALAEICARTFGDRAPGVLLDRITFGSYARRFPGEDSPSAWLSRDAASNQEYDEDPHTRALFTYRGYCDLFTMLLAATGRKWAGRVDKRLPILLASGGEDPVGDCGRGVVQVYERLKLAGAMDVACKIYPEARHELLHEINREEVFFDIVRWMEERLPRANPGVR